MGHLTLLLVVFLGWPLTLLADGELALSDENVGRQMGVSSGEQLIIDTSQLSWPVQPPELIVLQCFSDYYSSPFRRDRLRYTLNVATLRPHDAPPFSGLREGGPVFIARQRAVCRCLGEGNVQCRS